MLKTQFANDFHRLGNESKSQTDATLKRLAADHFQFRIFRKSQRKERGATRKVTELDRFNRFRDADRFHTVRPLLENDLAVSGHCGNTTFSFRSESDHTKD
jgi:hypothetical protein